MPSFVDEISPVWIGEDRITLTLQDPELRRPGFGPKAFSMIVVQLDDSRCQPEGLIFPLEITLTGPRGGIVMRDFKRSSRWLSVALGRGILPSFIVKPIEGGPHLIRVAEVAHNRWWGSLTIDVIGERLK